MFKRLVLQTKRRRLQYNVTCIRVNRKAAFKIMGRQMHISARQGLKESYPQFEISSVNINACCKTAPPPVGPKNKAGKAYSSGLVFQPSSAPRIIISASLIFSPPYRLSLGSASISKQKCVPDSPDSLKSGHFRLYIRSLPRQKAYLPV